MRHNIRYKNKRFKSKAQYEKEQHWFRKCVYVLIIWFVGSLAWGAAEAGIEKIQSFTARFPVSVLAYARHENKIELIETDMPDAGLHEKLITIAEAHGADQEEMYKTVKCETAGTFSTDIQSGYRYKNGKQEQSFGLAQIHLPDHPHVSKDEAKDPDFALNFMAEKFAAGQKHLWSCYRNLKHQGKI